MVGVLMSVMIPNFCYNAVSKDLVSGKERRTSLTVFKYHAQKLIEVSWIDPISDDIENVLWKMFVSYLVFVVISECRNSTSPYACLAPGEFGEVEYFIDIIIRIIERSIRSIGFLIAVDIAVCYNVFHIASIPL